MKTIKEPAVKPFSVIKQICSQPRQYLVVVEMDPMSKTSHLTPINIDEANASDPETCNVLGPLSPSMLPPAPFTPYSVSRFSSASRKSFTSEDFRREPEEAENMKFQSVMPSQISMVRVLSKLASKGEQNRLKRVRANRESVQGLESLEEPGENGGKAKDAEEAVETNVNGEAYFLHEDGVFRPLNLCMSVKAHFRGYALRKNGIFKPLSGSPAAIEAGTLYRVTPTNKYSHADGGQEHTSRALHRIKNVSQLLMRGTSGQEEYMYVYDPHWEGFVRTDETRRFPPEKAILKPGDLRNSVHTQDSEYLFISADDALRKANRVEEVTNWQNLPAHRFSTNNPLSRSLTLPSKKFTSPQISPEPITQLPQTPAMFTRSAIKQNLRLDEQGSWLNIDLPLLQQDPQVDKPENRALHALSPLSPAQNTDNFPPNDVIYEESSLNGAVTPSSPSVIDFHKPISPASEIGISQAAALYAPALQQLANECVLVLCLYGSQIPSRPKLARIVIPNSASSDFDDEKLFLKMRDEYQKLRGFWRRWFSLKGLKHIDLIECYKNDKRQISPDSFPIDDHDFSPEKLLDSYFRPCNVSGDRHWVEWIYQLNSEENQYALEFIVGWRSEKILVAAVVPITLSISAGVLWCFLYPGQEHLVAFVLGIFMMCLGWSIVGLLAALSYVA